MGASAYAGEINRNRKAKADKILVLMGVYLSIHIKITPMMKIIAPATVNVPFHPKIDSVVIIARPVQFSFIPIIVN